MNESNSSDHFEAARNILYEGSFSFYFW